MYYGFNMIGYYCALYKNNPDTDLEHILRHISKGDQIQPQEMLECTTRPRPRNITQCLLKLQ